ncbi:MAG: MMPL family transporter [Candidatus Thiodiazotropha sp.]
MNSYYKKIDNFSVAMSNWILSNAKLVLLLCILVAIAIGSGGRFLVFSSDYRIFFSDQNPELEAFEGLQETYTKSDNILFVIEPSRGDVFNKNNLEKVAALTEEAWKIPYAIRVDSLTNFQNTTGEGDDLIVEDMFPDPGHLSDGERTARSEIALREPLLLNSLVSQSGKVTAINVTLSYPQKSVDEVPESIVAARALRDEYLTEHPDDKIYLTGVSMLNNAFTEAGFKDLGTLIPFMFVIILVFIYAILRSYVCTVIALTVIVLSSMVAMGAAGYAGIQLSPISGVAPIIILTMAVADSIHIFATLRKLLLSGASKADAIIEAIRVNFIPVIITSVTTIVGFLALNLSAAPPFWHLGNMTAIGIATACLYSLILLPALAWLMPIEGWKINDSHGHSHLLDKLAGFVIARPVQVALVTIVVCFSLMMFIPKLELNDQWTKYFDDSIQFRGDTDAALKYFGLYPIEFSVSADGPGGVNEPEYLAKLEEFVSFLRAQPHVEHVYSICEILKRINRNLNYEDESYYRVPQKRDLSAQYLLLYEMSLPYGLDLNDRVNINKSATRVTATLGNVSTAQTKEFLANAEAWMQANLPGYMAATKPTSTQVMFTYIAQRNVNDMVLGTWVAIVTISLVMILALGSIKIGILSLVSNAAPILVAFGAWSVLVGEVGFSVAAVASISLGIVVDDSVHFLSKYIRSRKELNYNSSESIRFTYQTVGLPIVINTIVLALGFLLLTQSAFKVNEDMGLLTTMSIIFSLVLDFLLLPSLLLIVDSAKRVSTALSAELNQNESS